MTLSLAEAIRTIRKRQSPDTTVEFAGMLGVSQSNISRWETGDTVPSAERLLVLYRLAETKEEKRVIVSAIRRTLGESGPSEEDLRQVIGEVQRLIDQPPTDEGPATREELLVGFVNLWSKYSAEPELLECFGEGLAYIDTRISLQTGQDLPPGLKLPAQQAETIFNDADPGELKVLEDMLAVYRAGDPIVADIRRAAAVLRKSKKSPAKPKAATHRSEPRV